MTTTGVINLQVFIFSTEMDAVLHRKLVEIKNCLETCLNFTI